MLNYIDNYLNRITMYRLVLYFLTLLFIWAVVLCLFGILYFKPYDLFFSAVILIAVSFITNRVFAKAFKVPANVESDYITAFILALIITPPALGPNYFSGLSFLVAVAVLAQASKYILAYRGKHLFNPAAFALALTAFTIYQSASWWVGTLWMQPLVLIGGLLVVRKIQRFDMILSFLAVATVSTIAISPSRSDIALLLGKIFVDSPTLFFAFIMLSEPMTTPPRRMMRVIYGALVGLLFGPLVHVGSVYSTPELALLLGNIFSYIVSPKQKYLLTFKSRQFLGTDTYDLIFESKIKLDFKPGQYLEWTMEHKNPDTRGNRRYFTIASSPTEADVRLGVKFYPNPSSFKSKMFTLQPGNAILAGQLSGDFTLPKDPEQKLTFIAGGIGITPFRSMLKYLLDKNERRDIVLFYSNKTSAEIAYSDVLTAAHNQLGIKTVNILTDQAGFLTAEKIKAETPDFLSRTYYVSGPRGMVTAFEKTLKDMGIHRTQFKSDFFPGYA